MIIKESSDEITTENHAEPQPTEKKKNSRVLIPTSYCSQVESTGFNGCKEPLTINIYLPAGPFAEEPVPSRHKKGRTTGEER